MTHRTQRRTPWMAAVGALALGVVSAGCPATEPPPPPPEALLGDPGEQKPRIAWKDYAPLQVEQFKAKSNKTNADYALKSTDAVAVEDSLGIMTFSSGGRPVVNARFVVAGTWDSQDKVWAWPWADPDARVAPEMLRVREFGERNLLDRIQQPSFAADKAQAYEAFAVAGSVIDAQGFYPQRDGTTFTFLLYTDIERVEASAPE